ncbi:hypothetical protein V8C86DRAFT_2747257 [Haematococcus lacustris]
MVARSLSRRAALAALQIALVALALAQAARNADYSSQHLADPEQNYGADAWSEELAASEVFDSTPPAAEDVRHQTHDVIKDLAAIIGQHVVTSLSPPPGMSANDPLLEGAVRLSRADRPSTVTSGRHLLQKATATARFVRASRRRISRGGASG